MRKRQSGFALVTHQRGSFAFAMSGMFLLATLTFCQAQDLKPNFGPGDLVSNDLISGGCPTLDGAMEVLSAMAQTGKARDVMQKYNCLPFPASMKLRVKGLMKFNIMQVETPDFPGSPPLFVAEGGFHKVPVSAAVVTSTLPRVKKGTHYSQAREQLMSLGYKGVKIPGADSCDASSDTTCFPEMESCAGTGEGNCLYAWEKGDAFVEVSTIGDPPEVASVSRGQKPKP